VNRNSTFLSRKNKKIYKKKEKKRTVEDRIFLSQIQKNKEDEKAHSESKTRAR
jgi:hypothetical protein